MDFPINTFQFVLIINDFPKIIVCSIYHYRCKDELTLNTFRKQSLQADKITLCALMVFPSQDNVTSTKSSSNFRLPRAATMFFWKLFHFKQKCSCGIATFAVLVCVNVCVWVNLPLGNLLKAFDQKLHSIVQLLWSVFCLVYFKHEPIIYFLLLLRPVERNL